MTSTVFGEVAARLLHNGYSPIPVTPGTKRCLEKGWSSLIVGTQQVVERWCQLKSGFSVGIVCGNVIGIDVDVYDPDVAEACGRKVDEFSCGKSLVRFGQRPKSLFLFRCDSEHFSKLVTSEFRIGDFERNKIEVLAKGQMFVGFGIHPDTGKPYEWPQNSPLDIAVSDLPVISKKEAVDLVNELSMLIQELGGENLNQLFETPQPEPSHRTQKLFAQEKDKIRKALMFIDPQNRDDWITVGHALKLKLGEEGLELYHAWSKSRPNGSRPINYQGEEDVEKTWASFKPSNTSLNAIWRRAAAAGYSCSEYIKTASTPHSSADIESMIDQMNEEWFVAFQSGKVYVCRERKDIATGQEGIEKFTPEEFNKAFANKTRSIGNKIQKDSITWFQHPRRRQYPMGIVCDPTAKVDGLYFNTWQGLAIAPNNADPKILVEHIEQIIGSGDREVTDYVKGWLAQAVQKPEDPAGVVLVLRGRQGTGKGLLGTAMLRIFGKHGHHIIQAEHLVGRFQGHLEDCVFLFADEAFFPGDPRIKGQLKSLITERLLTMEEKYVQAKPVLNRLSIIMASNEQFVVPAELDDRRFAVIDVSAEQQNKRDYFNEVWRTVDGPGLSGFLQYLLDYDISKFDIRKIPETAARTEQKEFLFDTDMEFIAWSLRRGSFYDGHAYEGRGDFYDWPKFLSTQLLYSFYEHWYKNECPRGRKVRQNELGELLTKFLSRSRPTGNWVINIRFDIGERPHGYKFGTLEQTRTSFEKAFGLKDFSWTDTDAAPIVGDIPF